MTQMELGLPFAVLGLAICAVWFEAIDLGKGKPSLHPWAFFAALSILAAWSFDVVSGAGIGAIVALGASAFFASRLDVSKAQRVIFAVITGAISLALATHALPGFKNPLLIEGARFSPADAPFTQYANFDKGIAGLILLAMFCARCKTVQEWRSTIRRTLPIAAMTIVATMGIAMILREVRPELKLPNYALIFLPTNLFLTCVAEEAFFRGFLQERLAQWLEKYERSPGIAVLPSGLVFGLAHVAGGGRYALIASIAGIGYAWAYQKTRRIEGAILAHFALNATHFVGFSYPRLM